MNFTIASGVVELLVEFLLASSNAIVSFLDSLSLILNECVELSAVVDTASAAILLPCSAGFVVASVSLAVEFETAVVVTSVVSVVKLV